MAAQAVPEAIAVLAVPEGIAAQAVPEGMAVQAVPGETGVPAVPEEMAVPGVIAVGEGDAATGGRGVMRPRIRDLSSALSRFVEFLKWSREAVT
jgi:hypothetical protein